MSPLINGRMAKSFILRRAGPQVKAFMERLGRDRLDKMVRLDLSIESLLLPDAQAQLRRSARTYGWAARSITEEEFVGLLPGWYREVVQQHGEKGLAWQTRELKVLRSFFGGA